jgi:hypothetical protein
MTVEAVLAESVVGFTGLEVFVPCSACTPPYHCCALAASILVAAGSEVVANVLLGWTATSSQTFTLTTAQQPQ